MKLFGFDKKVFFIGLTILPGFTYTPTFNKEGSKLWLNLNNFY